MTKNKIETKLQEIFKYNYLTKLITMIEVIKKMPVILALLTGKPLTAKNSDTGELYELMYSVQMKSYTVQKIEQSQRVNVFFTTKKSQNEKFNEELVVSRSGATPRH